MSNNLGKDASIIQEERIAKLFKGSRTPQSGGGKFVKGDILEAQGINLPGYLVECKTTIEPKLTYSIKKSLLDKAKQEAQQMGKRSAILAITLGEEFKDYFITDSTFIRDYVELKNSITELYMDTENQLRTIEQKASQITQSAKGGSYEVTELDKLSFQIHKNRLTSFLESLKALL